MLCWRAEILLPSVFYVSILPVNVRDEKNIIEENNEWIGDHYDIIP